MADSTILPGYRARLVSPDGVTTPEFYRFFQKLVGTQTIDQIVKVIEEIQNNPPTVATLQTMDGIVSIGTLASGFMQISLETIDQGVGGTLQTITIDEYGRVVESRQANTDDLPQGTINFYYDPSRIHPDDPSVVIRISGQDLYVSVGIIDCGIITMPSMGRITSTGDRRVTSTADHRITA